MHEIVWYSRLAVIVGAVILLVQAVTARSTPALTVLAMVFLIVGLLAFVAGLAMEGRAKQEPVPEIDESPQGGPSGESK
ncbi:MAG TPA: hypothetical protein VFB58_07860 [Chloroflexota bacterium]|nr:hypothetical protein [Chloroflexota bacterium]